MVYHMGLDRHLGVVGPAALCHMSRSIGALRHVTLAGRGAETNIVRVLYCTV